MRDVRTRAAENGAAHVRVGAPAHSFTTDFLATAPPSTPHKGRLPPRNKTEAGYFLLPLGQVGLDTCSDDGALRALSAS